MEPDCHRTWLPEIAQKAGRSTHRRSAASPPALLPRNILEFDTHDETLGLNFLLTYRVNSGTAFYVGYDDHYQQRVQFDDQVNITGRGYRQTNRAVFTKIQYLFRY